ncbi:hypothetical protein WJX81_001203 [Elliptochloris bilobata]|uniref:VPS10 domain-containing protein n=1 Tax=Elliptochloris bilobata TaxID=381761 RepID=A0AAW1SIU1_9CHLO
MLGGPAPTCPRIKKYPQDGSKLKPVQVEAPVVDLWWAGTPEEIDKYVFALTEASGLYVAGRVWRSDDYGRAGSWVDITTALPGALTPEPGADADAAGVMEIVYNEAHPDRLLVLGAAFHNWISTDFGKTFARVETPGRTLGFWMECKVHPTQPDWLLAKVRRMECEESGSATNPWCAFDLFVSQDFAKSWTNLTANSEGAVTSFWDFDWGATLQRNSEDSFPDETIFATAYESAATMKGPKPGWDKDMHFVISSDFFRSAHRKLVSCGNQFELIGSQVFVALPSDCPTHPDGSQRPVQPGASSSSVVLYSSANEGKDFGQVCLPVRDLDLGYNLVKTHDGANAFLIVDHDEEDMISARAPIGNIYAPGYNNTLYTLSMTRNYRRSFITDFGRVEGLPGVYLGNQLHESFRTDPRLAFEKYVQTKVTFDGGARWQDLNQPDSFRFPECNRCASARDLGKCQLHLHGPSSWHDGQDGRPSFYTHDNAPGVIMAVGNTGEYLEQAADAMCTWLSRDGGATWQDVAPYASIYEYGDYGGLLIMTKHETEGPADSLLFSIDQGTCWHEIGLEEAIDVGNIRVEPSAASHMFVVHGKACEKRPEHPTCTHTRTDANPVGKMYIVDFRPVMGTDWRDCSDADYEQWTNGPCLLGRNYTLSRRVHASECFSGRTYKRPVAAAAPCPCTAADVACEYGYEFAGHDCRAILGIDTSQCEALKGYQMSETHRRLVAGDTCAEVSLVIPDTDGRGHGPSAPAGAPSRGHGWTTFFVLLLVLGGGSGLFYAWWMFWASDSAKATLEETTAPVIGVLLSAASWVKDCVLAMAAQITGRQRRADAAEAFFQPLASGDFGLDADEEELGRAPPVLR